MSCEQVNRLDGRYAMVDLRRTFKRICIVILIIDCIKANRYQRNDFSHDHVINPNTICGNTAGLTASQAHLCSQKPHSVASAIQGMQIAVHECKEQFKHHRWNCSELESKDKLPQSSGFLLHFNGNRETAFSHAIASAGVVHQVAHACSIGKIEECRCLQNDQPHLTASERKEFHKQIEEQTSDVNQPVNYFERAGCNHNINYGMEFAGEFLDSAEEQDFVSRIISHNNRVGRLVVSNNMKENCRCHGTSGSCSQKTCWRETPDFRAVGLAIKQKYYKAVRVSQHTGNTAAISNSVVEHSGSPRSLYTVEDLIYFDYSPSYCTPHRRFNILGTHGRYCNHSAGIDVPNSCENLCCSRGYTIRAVKRTEQCRCRFHWCCYVHCEECEWQETVSVCN